MLQTEINLFYRTFYFSFFFSAWLICLNSFNSIIAQGGVEILLAYPIVFCVYYIVSIRRTPWCFVRDSDWPDRTLLQEPAHYTRRVCGGQQYSPNAPYTGVADIVVFLPRGNDRKLVSRAGLPSSSSSFSVTYFLSARRLKIRIFLCTWKKRKNETARCLLRSTYDFYLFDARNILRKTRNIACFLPSTVSKTALR